MTSKNPTEQTLHALDEAIARTVFKASPNPQYGVVSEIPDGISVFAERGMGPNRVFFSTNAERAKRLVEWLEAMASEARAGLDGR